MPRNKEPISILEAKNRSHMSKAEKERRRENELKVEVGDIRPPKHLTPAQKKKFKRLSKVLVDAGIFTELDVDSLARYIIAETFYRNASAEIKLAVESGAKISTLETAINAQDKYFKQCAKAADALGLTITSRCRLVAPQKEKEPENKFRSFA